MRRLPAFVVRTALVLTGLVLTGLVPGLITAFVPGSVQAATPEAEQAAELAAFRSALIPKREVGADAFIKAHPSWDGRGVVIAVFDTGVDPGAPGLAVTTTGQRKIVDIVDGTGSGDVDTRTRRKPEANGKLLGLSGRWLTLPDGVVNPSGEFRLGLKPASELFYGEVQKRLDDRRAAARTAAASLRAAERSRGPQAALLKSARAKASEDRSRAERDLLARDAALTALEAGSAGADPGALFDCLLWHDGTHWRVLVDTNEDGDLRNERVLRPFGVAGEFASFGDLTFANYGVQVYEGGDVLSLVTVSGDHGTHVASIAAGHVADERSRDGIAPGAQILSIKIGDIRIGGSSNQIGELRAAAVVARYKADIVNASWGGRSFYQDGRNANSRLYDALVMRYDVLAVVSAGNDGPALGTAGSAGAEARRVLGVGAYLSPEMGQVLYSALQPSRAGAQAFTSRGPTKDGDFGADVAAPGAALAAVSAETLQSGGLKAGTSMASPSAAGVAALVLSAARQSRLDASPARLRAALIGGAVPLPQEDVLARGAGLVNASGAWKKLNELQGLPAFAGFYDIEVDRGSFTNQGRGLMLRETITEPRRRMNVRVSPAWAESVPPAARVAFEADLQLKPSVPWISAPSHLHLTNGIRNFAAIVDAPPVPAGAIGSLNVARIDAFLAGKPGLGPVFSVPVTIIQPAPAASFKNHQLEAAVHLKPAVTQRHFVQAPANATRLRIWVKHRARDALVRSFFVQAAAYAAQTHVAEMTAQRGLVLEPGEERSFDLVLKPGTVAEVAYTLNFAASGEATLETRLEWLGAGLGSEPIAMPANGGWATVGLQPYADRDVKVEARIERAVHSFLPDSSVLLTQDERAEYPASALTPGPQRPPLLRQRFTLELKAPLTAHVLREADHYLFDAVGGGRVSFVHESGELLFDSFGSNEFTRPAVTLPKGKTTVIREFVAD